MRTVVSKTLGGDLLGSELQLIHHYPATLKDEGQSLRPIIMWFHSYLERERALTAARQKYQDEKGMVWNGCKISLLSWNGQKKLAGKRRKFAEVRKKLHNSWTTDPLWPFLQCLVLRGRRGGKVLMTYDSMQALYCGFLSTRFGVLFSWKMPKDGVMWKATLDRRQTRKFFQVISRNVNGLLNPVKRKRCLSFSKTCI